MELTEEEFADATANWWNHPVTHKTGLAMQAKAEQVFKELKSACAGSSDPRVAAAYARYVAYLEQATFYKSKGRQ